MSFFVKDLSIKTWMLLLVILHIASALGENDATQQTSIQFNPNLPEMTEVHLRQGVIFSRKQLAGEVNRIYYAFQGIPFAKPPVGKLRFKDPVLAGPWHVPRDGSMIPPQCPQLALEFFTEGQLKVEGEEDCLYLNVFTPKPHVSAKLPVMVWIHGGAYSFGNASFYSPLPLLNHEVVLVTVQYRLDTLGFLSTEDSVMPGNLGLKDQTLALRWVKVNIQKFGGDPDRITIFGESSGASSVHYQIITPQAKGLFHRAILQSGSALCPWALIGGHREVTMKLGQLFNCTILKGVSTSTNSEQLLDCLQRVPAKDIILASQNFAMWHYTPSLMKPRVDGQYIPDSPAVLVREGRYNKVNIISGNTKDEGADYTLDILTNPASVKGLRENFEVTAPLLLRFQEEDDAVYMAKRVFYRYLGDIQVDANKTAQFMKLIGDRLYSVCQDETTLFHFRDDLRSNHEVYRYKLLHRGQWSYSDLYNDPISKNLVTHADDLQYIFESAVWPFLPLKRTEDLFVRDIMLKLWTNFAATGVPTPTQSLGFNWTPMSQSGMEYLAIQTVPDMVLDDTCEDREFWKALPTKQNKILYPELFRNS